MVRSRVVDGFVRADFSFVFDISVVLFVFINVVINNLCAAIRQCNGILSFDCWTITNFMSGVNIGVTVCVNLMDSISEFVVFGCFFMVWSRVMRGMVDWGMMDRGGMVNGGSVEGCMGQWGSMVDWGMMDWGNMMRGGVKGCVMRGGMKGCGMVGGKASMRGTKD